MEIKPISMDDAKYLSRYYLENAAHLEPWGPATEEGYNTVPAWKKRIVERIEEQDKGYAVYFVAYTDKPREIVAVCSLTGISRGVFMACYMGYSVARTYEGKGYMKTLCQHAIDYAFTELGLNRVMANYMPDNIRSQKLLERLGFEKEGLAKRYLYINGIWEDHVLSSLVNEEIP